MMSNIQNTGNKEENIVNYINTIEFTMLAFWVTFTRITVTFYCPCNPVEIDKYIIEL